MNVTIYGRKTPHDKAELLREMEEVVENERYATNAEQALAHFAKSHYKVALFSDRTQPDIVYTNRRYGNGTDNGEGAQRSTGESKADMGAGV